MRTMGIVGETEKGFDVAVGCSDSLAAKIRSFTLSYHAVPGSRVLLLGFEGPYIIPSAHLHPFLRLRSLPGLARHSSHCRINVKITPSSANCQVSQVKTSRLILIPLCTSREPPHKFCISSRSNPHFPTITLRQIHTVSLYLFLSIALPLANNTSQHQRDSRIPPAKMFLSDHLTAKVLLPLLAASLFGTAVQGHMIMANPVPYGHETIDNSPLTGSNYPCKVTSDPATFYSRSGIDNTYPAGSSQTLSFKGSAVHGGGSCQLAVTNDMQPSASTDWRVILSIESGCPSTDGTNPATYNWTVPADLEPGQYSFAWTWISKLAGQPEYYMNCAPITVTAAAAAAKARARVRAKRDAALYPELFVANLDAINSCKTTPSSDPVYPDPGPNVERLLAGTASASFVTYTETGCVPMSQTQGSAALPVATAGRAAGSGSGANTTAAAPAVASSSPTASAATSSSPAASDTSGSGFATSTQAASDPSSSSFSSSSSSSSVVVLPSIVPITSTSQSNETATASASATLSSPDATSTTSAAVSSSATSGASAGSSEAGASSAPATASASASATQSSSSAASTSTSTAKPTATGSGSGSGSSNSTGSAGGVSAKSGTCTDEGTFNCVGSKYQQCASGAWTSMQDLPGGTTCTQGESSGLWARRDVRGDMFNLRRLRRGWRAEGN